MQAVAEIRIQNIFCKIPRRFKLHCSLMEFKLHLVYFMVKLYNQRNNRQK